LFVLRIHFHNLTKNLQEQLRLNNLTHLTGPIFSTPTSRSKMQRSDLLERPNHDSAQVKYQTRLLHSSEPEILMQTIKDLDNAKLSPTLNELFPPVKYFYTKSFQLHKSRSYERRAYRRCFFALLTSADIEHFVYFSH
jgi:hypothetical protein